MTESELKAVRMALSRIHGFNASKEHVFNRIEERCVTPETFKRETKPLDYLTGLKI
jgi:hypothetical protein